MPIVEYVINNVLEKRRPRMPRPIDIPVVFYPLLSLLSYYRNTAIQCDES
jgi:hypothetical protein